MPWKWEVRQAVSVRKSHNNIVISHPVPLSQITDGDSIQDGISLLNEKYAYVRENCIIYLANDSLQFNVANDQNACSFCEDLVSRSSIPPYSYVSM